MKIDTESTQADLEKLNKAALQRDLLKATPLNLASFLRYAVLFLLFPGMAAGFRIGLAITCLFSALLAGLLIGGVHGVIPFIIGAWFAAGAAVLAYVSAGVFRKAWRTTRRRRLCRKAQAGLKHATSTPNHTPLQWHKDSKGEFYIARFVLHAAGSGLHAVLFSIPQYDGRKIITGGVTGTTIIQSGGKPGAAFNALIFYRLEKGNHELTWAIPVEGRPAPAAEISLLNRLA